METSPQITPSTVSNGARGNSEPSLANLVHEIEVRASKSDDHIISAAILLKQVRLRIMAGELGPQVRWLEWARENIKLSDTRLAELFQIAGAPDPHAELERLRFFARERQRKFRQKHGPFGGSEHDPERIEIRQWASEAPIDEIRKIAKAIKTISGPQLEKEFLRVVFPKTKQCAPRWRAPSAQKLA